MGQKRAGCGDEVRLPEGVARALVADVDCQAVIERAQESDEPIISVASVEEYDIAGDADYAKVYGIGDGYIVFEMTGDSVSEAIALHEDHLSEYIERIFVDDPKRIVRRSGTEVAWRDSVVS